MRLPVAPLLARLDTEYRDTDLTPNALAVIMWGDRHVQASGPHGTGDISRLRRLRKQRSISYRLAEQIARAANIDFHEIGL